MEWLIAALVAFLTLKKDDKDSGSYDNGGGYIDAPVQPATKKGVPGSAIFWTHQTPAGFECAGYCNNVIRQGDNVIFSDLIAIDMTVKGGVDSPKFLSVPKASLRPVNAAMGCLVLPELIDAGILDGPCGTMLFDDVANAKDTWVKHGRHALTVPRKTPNLYQVSHDTDWAVFWQAAEPFPIDVEITPAGVA